MTRYNVGSTTSITISHWKFMNDTLLLAKNSWTNIRIIKGVLILFEVILGLKVNFHNSMLEGVNVPKSWMNEATLVIYRRIGDISFLYNWVYLLEEIFNLEKPSLCMGGRLLLLKFVLSSLLIYFLSFFKASTCTISCLELF